MLEQLCHSGRSYSYENRISRESDDDATIRGDWIRYSARLEVIVSNYLIECAIKTRIVQDFLKHRDEIDVVALDKEVCDEILGEYGDDSTAVSIRDTCNRIVHATEAWLEWSDDTDEQDEIYEFWSGVIKLSGDQNGVPWELQLFIEEWSFAMFQFHTYRQENVDWYSVWEG